MPSECLAHASTKKYKKLEAYHLLENLQSLKRIQKGKTTNWGGLGLRMGVPSAFELSASIMADDF